MNLNMKKIVIFYASFGMGHKSAAMAIRETFQKKYGINTEAVDFFEKFMPGFNNFVRLLYDTSVSRIPKAYGKFFRITDDMSGHPVSKEMDKVGFSSFEKFIAHESPDHVIATFPVSGRIERLKKNYGFTYSVVITDFGVHGSWIRTMWTSIFPPTKR